MHIKLEVQKMTFARQTAIIAATLIASLTTGQAQPKDQNWINNQQARYQQELRAYQKALDEFNKASQEGLEKSIGHLRDWSLDKLNGLIGISGDPALLMQNLTLVQNRCLDSEIRRSALL